MRHNRVTTVAMEKLKVLNIMSVCLYSCLSYPACTPHPYSTMIRHLQPAIYFHIISKMVWFLEKNYWTQNVSFDFLYSFCL